MIVIVTGSRNWTDRKTLFDRLDAVHQATPITLLVQGGARGADHLAFQWAVERGITWDQFDADWRQYGKAAGMRRNREMLDNYPAANVEAFPIGDSVGTRGCIREAQKRRMSVHVTEGNQ